ncbi:uncharacterized protein [Physcomitrium patens]|uniref:DUF1664 domain-containing protein n=1 Tax=Physcomitrium patens TaxID=3218 RepID=A0A2K1L8Y6_PHYPA|nr:uncharacterized protein LOC112291495 [Physcomitrium patens]PNR62500.1 hypothetical protein PHYPA_000924 [Physcomitrium patens]|eukprot:XP_024394764.1 uncharacterized protein LOC112291495 [Physcomitrella patens]
MAALGATKFLVLVGAGLMGSVMVSNSKLADFVGDLSKVLSKHLKENGQKGDGVGKDAALSLQVRKLTEELRNLASSSGTVTVVQSGSGSGTSFTSFILPAAVVGAAGYSYMWWRGFSFGDIMYVTRKGMNNAVTGMGKQLDQVSAALSSTRKHMNQRLDSVSSKLDDSVVVTGLIKDQVEEVKGTVGRSIYEIGNVNRKMEDLGVKISEVQESQNFANQGIILLVEWVHRLNLVAPAKNRELAQSFNSWYLKANSMERSASSSTLLTLPGLKQLFSEALEPTPFNNFPEGTPVRDSDEFKSPGLNLPSPSLGFSSNHTPARTKSASMVSRSSFGRLSSGLSSFAGFSGIACYLA